MFNILSNLLFVFTFQKNNFYKEYDNSEYSIIPLSIYIRVNQFWKILKFMWSSLWLNKWIIDSMILGMKISKRK